MSAKLDYSDDSSSFEQPCFKPPEYKMNPSSPPVVTRCLKERTARIFHSGDLTDVVFVVGEKNAETRFSAHKLLLAITSEVFMAMFYGKIAEKTPEIRVPDIEPDTFEALLRYIYMDEVHITSEDMALKLAFAANKYLLQDLKEQCCRYLFENMKVDSACQIYEAALLLNEDQLMDKARTVILKEADNVLAASSFSMAKKSTVEMIAKQNLMNLSSEELLFQSLLRWATSESVRQGLHPSPQNVRKILDPILCNVRFLTMTPDEFVKGPAMSEIFSDAEIASIIMNIVHQDARPLPLCSSNVRTKRHPKEFNLDVFWSQPPSDFFTKQHSYFSPSVLQKRDFYLGVMSKNMEIELVEIGIYVTHFNNGIPLDINALKALQNISLSGKVSIMVHEGMDYSEDIPVTVTISAHFASVRFPRPLALIPNVPYEIMLTVAVTSNNICFHTVADYKKRDMSCGNVNFSFSAKNQYAIHKIVFSTVSSQGMTVVEDESNKIPNRVRLLTNFLLQVKNALSVPY